MMLRKLGIGLVACVLGVVLAELFLRLAAPHVMTPSELRSASLLHEASDHARSELAREAREVRPKPGVVWRINADGLRGERLGPKRDANVVRLVVLGGSAAFDLGASDPEDWPHKVAAGLTSAATPVEVINAAIPGHTIADSLGRLQAHGQRWRPDIVLLYHGWNDIKELAEPVTPTRDFRPNPLLTPPSPGVGLLVDNTQLGARLWHAAMVAKHDLADRGLEGRKRRPLKGQIDSRAGLARIQAQLRAFDKAARALGAVPVFVAQARLVTRDLSEADQERVDYGAVGLGHLALLAQYDRLDGLLFVAGGAEGAGFIDAHAGIGGRADFFDDHVHLSRAGSKALVGVMVDGLRPFVRSIAARLQR